MKNEAVDLLKEIAVDQAESKRTLALLESRVEIMREELKDAATVIRRLKLAQENEKAFAREQAETNDQMRAQLARLEKLMKKQAQ